MCSRLYVQSYKASGAAGLALQQGECAWGYEKGENKSQPFAPCRVPLERI